MSFSSNLILLGAAGAGGAENWILEGPTQGQVQDAVAMTVDSNENIYILTRFALLKVNKDGEILWIKTLSNFFAGDGSVITTDSSNNIYAATQSSSSTTTVAKFDPSGSCLWSVNNGSNSSLNTFTYSSVTQRLYKLGTTGPQFCQFDLNGGETNPRNISGANSPSFSNNGGMAVDSGGNVYFAITKNTTVGGNDSSKFLVFKLNSNLDVVWAKQFAYASSTTTPNEAVDLKLYGSTLYVCGYFVLSSEEISIAFTVNTSDGSLGGTARANAILPGTTNTISNFSGIPYRSLELDTNGDGYYFGEVNSAQNASKKIAWLWKRNTSLSNYYANYFILNPGNFTENINQLEGMAAVPGPGNSVYCLLRRTDSSSSVNRLYLAKVPKDGSKTGTYTGVSGTIGYLPYNQQTGGPGMGDLGSLTLFSNTNLSFTFSSITVGTSDLTSFSENLIEF